MNSNFTFVVGLDVGRVDGIGVDLVRALSSSISKRYHDCEIPTKNSLAYLACLAFKDSNLAKSAVPVPYGLLAQPNLPLVNVLPDWQREQRLARGDKRNRVRLNLLIEDTTPLFMAETWLVVIERPNQIVQFSLPRCGRFVRAGCVVCNSRSQMMLHVKCVHCTPVMH